MAIAAAEHWVRPAAACCTLERVAGRPHAAVPLHCGAAHAMRMCPLGQPKTLQACMRSGCSTGTGLASSSLSCLRHCQPASDNPDACTAWPPVMGCLGTLPAASSPPTAPCLPDTWLSCCRLGWLSRANSGPPAQLDFVYHQDNANMPIHYLATGPTGWCVHSAVCQAHHTRAPVHFC